MMKSIYIGNLPFSMRREDVIKVFEPFGEVYSVRLINDKQTGRPRGFGFVEMDEGSGEKAIQALNGSDCGGRTIVVSFARERDEQAAVN